MAYKEVLRVEIQEVIRRWQAGGNQRQIAEGTGLSRATVRKYPCLRRGRLCRRQNAAGVVQDGPVPDEEQLSQLAGISRAGPRMVETPVEDSLAPWADQIYQWLTGDRLTVTRIQELLAARGCTVSYTSLRRFIRKRNWGRRSVRTVRMADTAAGEVVEGDVQFFQGQDQGSVFYVLSGHDDLLTGAYSVGKNTSASYGRFPMPVNHVAPLVPRCRSSPLQCDRQYGDVISRRDGLPSLSRRPDFALQQLPGVFQAREP